MSEAPVSPELIALQQAVVGRFSIVRELGRGGMGIVFLARDVALDRPVAIKLLPPEFSISGQHRERFLREARTAARLTHPHIVPIHAVEEHGDLVFFVMSYVDGETLAERVLRAGMLDPREAIRITREVAWALGHAHANGIVHRDVKPENVLIERDSGRALVTDFGIAQAADSAISSARGRIAGTPRYMSPEQAAGETVDGRSDIYSLGATAFFMVAGRSPFDGATAAALLVKHLNEPVPIVRAMNPRVPLDFASAIERCLAKDPAARFQTADDLARALEPSTDRVAPRVATFLRDMEVVGGEIGLAVSGLGSSAMMAFIATRQTAVNPSFADSISLTVALVLFFGAAATMGGLAIVRLLHVTDRMRSLLRTGYGHSAVKPAVAELQRDVVPTKSGVIATGVHIAGTLLAIQLTREGSGWLPVIGAAAAVAIPTTAFRQLWTEKRVWPRLLAGRVGRWLFRVASWGTGSTDAKPVAGEPTALAIGAAAADLFRALPESVQAEYAQLPGVIERLESEALLHREADDPRARERFAAAVTALESLRLDLLRLHAGTPLRGDLTGSVEAARRLGADIDARLAAERELDQALRKPAG